MEKLTEFWILWCPTAEPPPKVRFSTEEGARTSAELMAKNHYPAEFIVLKSVASCKAERNIKWEEKEKKNGKSC